MGATLFGLLVVGLIVAAIALKEAAKAPVAVETSREDKILFVGRSALYSAVSGVQGGLKLMLYVNPPPPPPSSESLGESDGSIMGDLNKLYRGIKQVAKDTMCDFEVHGNLATYFPTYPTELKPRSARELFGLAEPLIAKQREIAENCRRGDRVLVCLHWYEMVKPGKHPTEATPRRCWVELLEHLPAESAPGDDSLLRA